MLKQVSDGRLSASRSTDTRVVKVCFWPGASSASAPTSEALDALRRRRDLERESREAELKTDEASKQPVGAAAGADAKSSDEGGQ